MRENYPQSRFPTEGPLRAGQRVPFVIGEGRVQADIVSIDTDGPGTVMQLTHEDPEPSRRGGGNA